MYAIVEIAGKQYKVEKDATINVDRLEKGSSDDIILDKVLLLANGENLQIGQPYLANVKIKAKMLGEVKGDKVKGIRFKQRKNQQRTLGHRQIYTQLQINDLQVN